MRYQGKGEHSVNELEQIISELQDTLALDIDDKIIRPENFGEVWEDGNGHLCVIANAPEGIGRLWCGFIPTSSTLAINPIPQNMIHDRNGWELIYSPDKEVVARIKEVEDDSIKRIVIEDVTWGVDFTSRHTPKEVYGPCTPDGFKHVQEKYALHKQQPMKMILEIPCDQK